MTFAERRRLELDYKEWLKRESIANGVAIKDCALTVIGYLDSKGLINKMPKWNPINSGKLPENNEEVWITDVEEGTSTLMDFSDKFFKMYFSQNIGCVVEGKRMRVSPTDKSFACSK